MSVLKMLGLRSAAKVRNDQAEVFSAQLRQLTERSDYAKLEELLTTTSDDDRERMTYGFSLWDKSVPLSKKWVLRHPDSAFANLLLGASFIVSGWKIRGASYAENVDENSWRPFGDKLSSAIEHLQNAAQLNKTISDPYSWLIHAGIGLEISGEEQKQLFSEAIARNSLHWPSHYKYHLTLTKKWGGSHLEMFDFAHNCTKVAPKGSLLHCLVPASYNEYLLAENKSKGIRESLKEPRIIEDITASLYSWLDATAENLPVKLQNISGGFKSYALNEFGMALYICGAKKEAKEVLTAINGVIEPTPWIWIGKGIRDRINPAFIYDRACRDVGVTPRW